MKRFIEGVDRGQSSMFPERLEDWIGEDNPVRVGWFENSGCERELAQAQLEGGLLR